MTRYGFKILLKCGEAILKIISSEKKFYTSKPSVGGQLRIFSTRILTKIKLFLPMSIYSDKLILTGAICKET